MEDQTVDDAAIIVAVDSEPVPADDPGVNGEGEQWQGEPTDRAALAALADVQASEQTQAAAEVVQAEHEQTQTALLANLTTLVASEMSQMRESLALALEAQTAEIARLENQLSDFQTSLTPTAKPPRRNPAQRAEERRKRSTDRREKRRKV